MDLCQVRSWRVREPVWCKTWKGNEGFPVSSTWTWSHGILFMVVWIGLCHIFHGNCSQVDNELSVCFCFCLYFIIHIFYGRGLGGSLASCNYSCWSFGVTMATKYVLCQVGFLLCSFRLWRSQDTSEWSESPITQFLAFTWRIPWQPVVSFVFEGPLLTSVWNALPLPHLGCWGKVDICAWAEEMASQKTQPRPSLIQLNMAPKCVQWARLHLGFKNNNFLD